MYDYGYNTPYSCCYSMDSNLIQNIEEYINDEIKDSKYYAILASKAPTQRAKDLLMEFSSDELKHSKNMMRAYCMITGKKYTPPVVEEPQVPSYNEALKVRILAETSDYKKYGEQYLKACVPWLKDLFYMTRTVEAQHAMRMPILKWEAEKS